MEHLFVYGSLRQAAGHAMHAVLDCHAQLLGSGYVQGVMYDINAYPGLVLGRHRTGRGQGSSGKVYGEIYRLLDPQLVFRRLDHYEQCSLHFPRPHEFQRTRTRVTLQDGQTLPAWVYEYHFDTSRKTVIRSGDYLAHLVKE